MIDDQIENLRGFGIDRICQITSTLTTEERQMVSGSLKRGEYHFCYVAPERFQSQEFRDSLRSLTESTGVSLIAVDEAHCVSEWGHDFRPAYLNIARVSREYCATDRIAPPLMALTGTASRAVLKDVQRELAIEEFEALITPTTFDRPELHFRTIDCKSKEKMARLEGVLETVPADFNEEFASFYNPKGSRTRSGLLFCPHVGGNFGVVHVSDEVESRLGRPVPYYAGKTPKGFLDDDWQITKRQTAQRFKRNDFPLLACTKAFGMGIDKPNVRYTIHYGIPASIESFYQEAGRAGRDRQDAQCVILFSNDDRERTKTLLSPTLEADALHGHMDQVTWNNGDDITRVLYFHQSSFNGLHKDHEDVKRLITEIGDSQEERSVEIPWSNEVLLDRERAVHRLLTIGVVRDYTKDFTSRRMHVELTGHDKGQIAEHLYQYIAGYQIPVAAKYERRLLQHIDRPYSDFVSHAAGELIAFVYEVIERGRRQSLSEMLSLCQDCPDDESFRARILAYLGTSVFSTAISDTIDSPDGGLGVALTNLRNISSVIDAAQLRGESGRALEAYPTHTGLHLIRAISESMAGSPNSDTVQEHVAACVKFSVDLLGHSCDSIVKTVIEATLCAGDARPSLAGPIIDGMIAGLQNVDAFDDSVGESRRAIRTVVRELPAEMVDHGIASLLDGLNAQLLSVLEK